MLALLIKTLVYQHVTQFHKKDCGAMQNNTYQVMTVTAL